MPKCPDCKETKLPSDFYRDSSRPFGRHAYCKVCDSRRDAVRNNTPQRHEFYRLCARKRYNGNICGYRDKLAKLCSKRTPKNIARKAFRNAVDRGKIIKPRICSKCLKPTPKIHGHHTDYSKPFDVMWLCQRCHFDIHKGERFSHSNTTAQRLMGEGSK